MKKRSLVWVLVIVIAILTACSFRTDYIPKDYDSEVAENNRETLNKTVNSVVDGVGEGITTIAKALGFNIKEEIAEKTDEVLDNVTSSVTSAAKDGIEKAKEQISQGKLLDETAANEELTEVSLVRVKDGDTIVVSIDGEEQTVRFIGVDTPESVNPDESKNTIYGENASNYTKNLLNGITTLYLQYDVSQTDKYDRTLAYVWMRNNIDTGNKNDVANYMVNGMLVRNGYAKDKIYEPNVAYADTFAELCEEAKETKTGLWQHDEFAALWQ